jgi:hypothetical protein
MGCGAQGLSHAGLASEVQADDMAGLTAQFEDRTETRAAGVVDQVSRILRESHAGSGQDLAYTVDLSWLSTRVVASSIKARKTTVKIKKEIIYLVTLTY